MPVSEKEKPRIATTTAGLRGTEWNEERLPSGVTLTAHALRTADLASTTGYLSRRGGERTVVYQCICARSSSQLITSPRFYSADAPCGFKKILFAGQSTCVSNMKRRLLILRRAKTFFAMS